MEQLLLVNPRKRRSRNAKGQFVKGHARAANPKRRRRARRHNPVAALANPRRRRSAPMSLRRMKRRSRRRNPISTGGIGALFMQAAQGALGATAVNVATNYLPLPATLQSGMARHAVKGAVAVALGVFGGKLIGPMAKRLALGSLTVTLTDVIKEFGSKTGINMAGVGWASPAPMLGEYVRAPALPAPSPYDDAMAQSSMMGEYIY